jgi:hypothetical protein
LDSIPSIYTREFMGKQLKKRNLKRNHRVLLVAAEEEEE